MRMKLEHRVCPRVELVFAMLNHANAEIKYLVVRLSLSLEHVFGDIIILLQ